MPLIIFAIPIYMMFQWVGLLDTQLGLIIAYVPIVLPLMIWILEGFFREYPDEILEAARIDGAGAWTIALRLKLPMIRKWVAYMVILSFATGTQLFVEPQLVNEASLGAVPDTWSANQLAYQLAFRYARFNEAAAISVDLLVIGLIAAVLIVTRTGLFKKDD